LTPIVPGEPVLYASSDLEVCIHECRFAADDELFVASLEPVRPLRLLDLAVVLPEGEGVTEFESLDMAIHMLFMTGEHSYDISSAIGNDNRKLTTCDHRILTTPGG
jgi:hypothetical protein